MKFCTDFHSDVLSHIFVRGKLFLSNIAAKAKMAAIDRFKDKLWLNTEQMYYLLFLSTSLFSFEAIWCIMCSVMEGLTNPNMGVNDF